MVANMPEHVFISYHHADGDFADYLRMKLKENGLEVWLADAALTAGDDWRAEIDQAIEGASSLIVIMTPDAKASDYVTYEWAFAIGAGIKVIPLLLKETELHPRLESLHYLDFRDRKARPWNDLMKALKEKTKVGPKGDLESTGKNAQPCTIKIPDNVPDTIKNAILKIDSTNTREREDAIKFIGQYKHPASREVLLSALIAHPLCDVKESASLALINYKDADTVSRLIEALKDDNEDVRRTSAQALGYIKNLQAVPALIDALKDKNDDVRAVSASALGRIQDPQAAPALVEALKDKNANVRYMSAIALGRIQDAQAVPALIEVFKDTNEDVRRGSAQALGCIRDVQAVPTLIEALRDKNSLVRADAREGLIKIGSMAVPSLIDALFDKDGDIHTLALQALNDIGTSEAFAAIKKWHDASPAT
jgi:hypothetical protein